MKFSTIGNKAQAAIGADADVDIHHFIQGELA